MREHVESGGHFSLWGVHDGGMNHDAVQPVLPLLTAVPSPSVADRPAPSGAVVMRRHLAPVEHNPQVAVDPLWLGFVAVYGVVTAHGAAESLPVAAAALDSAAGLEPGTYLSWCTGEAVPLLRQLQAVAGAVGESVTFFTVPQNEAGWQTEPAAVQAREYLQYVAR